MLFRSEKTESKLKFPPILMTEEVFSGFKAANDGRFSIKQNLWKEVSTEGIKNITSKVYGGAVTWKI